MPNTRPTTIPTALLEVRRALARVDMPALRDALLNLSGEDRGVLEHQLGPPAVRRLSQNARRVRRGSRGRVVLIHGIMGGKLASVEGDDDPDLVWVDYFRLCAGRIADFKLDADAHPSDPDQRVVTCGLLDQYLPMISELDAEWNVLPFAFDWRLDIDDSAHVLNDAITAWAKGEPAHIVAHSMGGLVSRRFMQLHPETWKTMADPQQLTRGGRLVMLGTPNRGSFAIPFVLTGAEKTVQLLERFDFKHDMNELLAIINTFPGSYQMMPSPLHAFGDDRLKFYKQATWGTFPVTQSNLDLGHKFQESLNDVVAPERMVYVAGYNQATPYRVRVDGPGDFSYQETLDGDGRVPHELGLLPSVKTFYVAELHGDLPRNDAVLASIHELLETGTTTGLLSQLPVTRSLARAPVWRKAAEIAPVPPAIDALAPIMATRRSANMPSPNDQARLEAALVEDIVGAPRGSPPHDTSKRAAPTDAHRRAKARDALRIEVVWGDICKVDGDVYAAGHYRGVLPQRGELALDRVVSAEDGNTEFNPDSLLITSLTRRGVIRGAVGDVNFFPWPHPGRRQRTVAIAGMGFPGTFGRPQLVRMARGLANAVTALPNIRTMNMLLIGSGPGGLPVKMALEGLLDGMIESFDGSVPRSRVRTLRIVEWDRTQAQKILDKLKVVALKPETQAAIAMSIAPEVVVGEGGRVGDDLALSALLVMTARAGQKGRRTKASANAVLTRLLAGTRVSPQLRKRYADSLENLGRSAKGSAIEAGARLGLVRARDDDEISSVPTRISYTGIDAGVRAAALTDSAVVPERFIALDWGLIDELIRDMTDPPDPSKIEGLSQLLARFVVPRDFRDLFGSSESTIFEVDRRTARIHWEMLGLLRDQASSRTPMALQGAVARQLRTTYSAAPTQRVDGSAPLRALVIADPGDPAQGQSLPGARREGLEVIKLLKARQVDVVAMIGAPDPAAPRAIREYPAATRLEVLRVLNENRFDLLHYAGHGDFDRADPENRAGWVFADGLLSSRELALVDDVPPLVVANACLSGLTSDAYATTDELSRLRVPDDYLLPGLADEFFKRGARNYVGAAWEVNDLGAILFATELYSALLPDARQRTNGTTLGEALLQARKALKLRENDFGALWAAYQHYGDPAFRLASSPAPETRTSRRAKK